MNRLRQKSKWKSIVSCSRHIKARCTTTAAPVFEHKTIQRSNPAVANRRVDSTWINTDQKIQQQTSEAHSAYLKVMAESHLSFLKAAESSNIAFMRFFTGQPAVSSDVDSG
ncbi:MAG: hypothetical protein R2875_18460 [Desulfobacterales bacterium]